MLKFDFVAAHSAEDAVAQLKERGPGGKLLAGGTDILLQIKARVVRPTYVVDLSHVEELGQIDVRPGEGVWIGSMVRMREIQQSAFLRERFGIVVDGALLVGSIQIRSLATVGGNLCNAAPSADIAPPLIAAGARAEILGPGGRRSVGLDEFFLGPRHTVLGHDDVLLGVFIPNPAARSGGHYLRHTPRKEMDIAVVGVGSAISLENGHCRNVRVVLGAVAPTPVRARRAEELLSGQTLSVELIDAAAKLAVEHAHPIDDVRGTVAFRRHLVEVLTRRTLTEAWRQAAAGSA